MPKIIQKIDENRAISGIGSGILYKNSSGKFSVLALTDKVPSVKGDKESLSVPNTLSDTEGSIEGMTKLEKVTFEPYDHRDNRRKFAKLEGQVLDIISFGSDRVGERYTGTVSYKVGDRENGSVTKATSTITPRSYTGDVDDIMPFYQKTAVFLNVPALIELDTVTKKFDLDVSVEPTGTTIAATSEAPSIATATITGTKLAITGVKEGSCVIVLKATGEDIATTETTILVDVPKLSA